ncbi:MAG: winged helix-turn-helix transcriptional regulator [Thermoplasmatota archaeon]
MASRKLIVTSTPRMDLCPVTETAKLIGKKWYLIILHELTKDPLGFNELKRAVRGISAKVLSESLSELEARGLVTRSVYSDAPVRVEYALTEKGNELDAMFGAMKSWGEKWAICLDAAPPRARADRRDVADTAR